MFPSLLRIAWTLLALHLLKRLDEALHRLKCRQYKAGRHRLFRALARLSRPVCDRVSLLDHAR